jgi:hypothetical protein
MRRYHHIGIPTAMPRDGEQFLEEYGMYVSGYEQSDYGIEWMRFEPDSPLPELVKTVPHVAFEAGCHRGIHRGERRPDRVPAARDLTAPSTLQLPCYLAVVARSPRYP